MRRHLIPLSRGHGILLGLLLLGGPSLPPPAARAITGDFVPELAVVDSMVTEFMERWDLPGAAVAIAKDGRLVYSRGFGYADTALQEPVFPQSRFRVASISKSITAVTVMRLMEVGLLDVDERVFGPAGILSDSLYADILDSRVLDITVRNLLQHTAGWNSTVSGDPMYEPVDIALAMGEAPPADAVTTIRYMLGQPLDFTPGTQYHYANFGYCVLGRVIETVTGMDYDDAVQQYVLEPLGVPAMRIARNFYEERGIFEATYYDYPGAPLRPSFYGDGTLVPAPYGYFDLQPFDSAAGWMAAATDLLRILLGVDGDPDWPDILQPATLELMLTPCPVQPNYAMGWSLDGPEYWGHTGSIPGSSTIFYRCPDGVRMAFLFNLLPETLHQYWTEQGNMITDIMASVTTWPTHDIWDPLADAGGAAAPAALLLQPNVPNPFNPATTIRFELPRQEHVTLRICDVRGRLVRSLIDQWQPAGPQAILWNGCDDSGTTVSSGVYVATLQAGDQMARRCMVLVK